MGTPLHKRVLVQPDQLETRSKGGIIIPPSAQQPTCGGTLVQFAADCINPYLEIGARVLYGQYAGSEVTFEEGAFLLMYETDLTYIFP